MNSPQIEIIDQTSDKATACVIFLHGVGRSGEWLKNRILNKLGDRAKFPHIKFIFPTAPTAYCAFSETVVPSWFNFKRSKDDPRMIYCDFNMDEVKKSKLVIDQIVNDVIKSGIPMERIILAGISQGAGLALITSYVEEHRFFKGVLSLCGVYSIKVFDKTIKCIAESPSLYQIQFANDFIIDLYSVKKGLEFLNSIGVKCKFDILEGDRHEPNRTMFELAYTWIGNMLPNNV